MPTVHLICGLPCSGKTTYARGLRNLDSVVFSIDRWLITAFGRYRSRRWGTKNIRDEYWRVAS